jgi:hypothetical protein
MILLFIFVGGIAAVLVVAATYWWNFPTAIPLDNAKWGQFGDFFGGTLNPLLSFLGLIALLATLWVQNTELIATRTLFEQSVHAQENQTIVALMPARFTLITLRLQHDYQQLAQEQELINQGRGSVTRKQDLEAHIQILFADADATLDKIRTLFDL